VSAAPAAQAPGAQAPPKASAAANVPVAINRELFSFLSKAFCLRMVVPVEIGLA
jgi:hypothetical protein